MEWKEWNGTEWNWIKNHIILSKNCVHYNKHYTKFPWALWETKKRKWLIYGLIRNGLCSLWPFSTRFLVSDYVFYHYRKKVNIIQFLFANIMWLVRKQNEEEFNLLLAKVSKNFVKENIQINNFKVCDNCTF